MRSAEERRAARAASPLLAEDKGFRGRWDRTVWFAQDRAPWTASPWLNQWGVGAAAFVLAVLAALLVSPYWDFLGTTGTANVLLVLSVGLAFNRSGMLYLCPLAFAAAGAWVAGWCSVDLHLPFLVGLVLAGVIAVPLGGVIGLLALRLRGMNLAIATLALNSVVQVMLSVWPIPGSNDNRPVQRPAFAQLPGQYFLLSLLIMAVICLAVALLLRSRVGASWMMIKSERGAAGGGANVLRAKIEVFVACSVIATIAGVIMIGQSGTVGSTSFSDGASLLIVVVAILAGAGRLEGAFAGGAAAAFVPEILLRLGIPTEFGAIVFGFGAVQALSQGGDGIAGLQQARRAARRTRRARARLARLASDIPADGQVSGAPAEGGSGAGEGKRGEAAPSALARARTASRPDAAPRDAAPRDAAHRDAAQQAPALQIRGLTVSYGAVRAVDNVDLSVPRGAVTGLIGPNGAGKTTLIDAASGFVAQATGDVLLNGSSLHGFPPHRRALVGLRRTFQQSRLVEDITVEQYVRFVTHSSLKKSDIDEVLAFFGCPNSERRIGSLDVPTRRLTELAAAVACQPAVLMLDEPGAGLGEEESMSLAHTLKKLPEWFGMAVVLVEHDMTMVQAACSILTVLESGRVLATGQPGKVLSQDDVRLAYLGPGGT